MVRKAKCTRLDGLCNLTDDEKAERDAKMQYWLNQRKIELVARASGWPITD